MNSQGTMMRGAPSMPSLKHAENTLPDWCLAP